WAAIFYRYFRDDPREHHGVNAAELALIGGARKPAALGALPGERLSHGAVPFAKMIGNPTIIALCLMYAGTIYGWYFYLNWLPTCLLEARGFDLKSTGWFAAAPLVGIAVGVLIGGVLGDALPRRLGPREGRRVQGLLGLPAAAGAVTAATATSNPVASA